MDTITMSGKEAPRPGILKALCDDRITNREAATAFAPDHPAGAAPQGPLPRGRGQPSPQRLAGPVREQIATLLTTVYPGFNDAHLTEKLREEHGLEVGRPTVRRLRRALGRPATRRRRARPHRQRRRREAAAGSLVQIDGSAFDWLEGHGPAMTLLGAIDDATGAVLALHFRPPEDLHGHATLFHQLFTTHGLPLAFYGDRLNVFVRNDRHWTLAEQLQGTQPPTHLGRMLQALEGRTQRYVHGQGWWTPAPAGATHACSAHHALLALTNNGCRWCPSGCGNSWRGFRSLDDLIRPPQH